MNGNFIFKDVAQDKAGLEDALRNLPINATPEITHEVFRESHLSLATAQKKFSKRIFFEVRRDPDSGEEEYFVTPLRTYAVSGILRYTPNQSTTHNFKILSAWENLLEVRLKSGSRDYVFNLLFKGYEIT